MQSLELHSFHQTHGARFLTVRDREVVAGYGTLEAEHGYLTRTAGVSDLSFRGRLCLTGEDRQRFLHGQITNDVKELKPGESRYAALVTAKGKLVCDLNVVCLQDELLVDLEPGYSGAVTERLEKFIIADDVQVVDMAAHYSLLSIQGPRASEVLSRIELATKSCPAPGQSIQVKDPALGEICCVNQPRIGNSGFDLFVPASTADALARRMVAAVKEVGGYLTGWNALELARIEAGMPRFGQDMDEANLAPETGIETRAISYTKGCYIGQEVIARIRTYGQVAKALRGLVLGGDSPDLPSKGARLLREDREVGWITSAVHSIRLNRDVALGYVRKECNAPGTELAVEVGPIRRPAKVVALPFTAQE